ncbi:hypothetical protein ABT263_38300 [Kitasatospora sp. NPDC001603]|uniref:hypothetical protein n=1 Tax=Kitasatospora sp. NPDC001603 TaxID=3154388 RepID=UPI00332DBC0E
MTWLHCRESPAAAAVLVQAALERSSGLSDVTAFGRPSPWPPHLPGVPLQNRPVTTEAFTNVGFRTRDQWLLLHRPHPRPAGPPPGGQDPSGHPVHWITPDGGLHAGRETHRPAVEAVPAGLWRFRIGRSLELLDRSAGCEALATVDLLAPDASPRCAMLAAAGFEETDLLRSLVLA